MASGLVFVLFCFVLKKAREKSSPSSQPPRALRPAPGVSSPSSQLQQPLFQNKGALPLPCTQGPALPWDKEGLLPSALSFCTRPPPLPPCQASRLQPALTLCMRTHACTPIHCHTRVPSHAPSHPHTCARTPHTLREAPRPSLPRELLLLRTPAPSLRVALAPEPPRGRLRLLGPAFSSRAVPRCPPRRLPSH